MLRPAGWPKVRLNGWAVPGAVDVEGGAENVRDPREPELNPLLMRASAEDAVASMIGSESAIVSAIA